MVNKLPNFMFMQKFFDWKIILILVLLIWIVVQTCTAPPEPVEDTRKYDSLISVTQKGELKAKEFAQQRRIDSVEAINSKESYLASVKKKDAQIAYYRAHPKVIEVIKTVPVIDSAFRAYDSAIVIRDDRIAELSGELYDCQKMASNAEENFQATLQAQHGANAELVEDNQGLKKDLRKERRRGRLAKALIPIALIGGFLLAQ